VPRDPSNKKGRLILQPPISETFYQTVLGLLRFPLWPFAQSLREPFSPRSSEPIDRRLAIVLLRVCAPEVKKKFRKVRKEKYRELFFFKK
jgi:hypothetical protein